MLSDIAKHENSLRAVDFDTFYKFVSSVKLDRTCPGTKARLVICVSIMLNPYKWLLIYKLGFWFKGTEKAGFLGAMWGVIASNLQLPTSVSIHNFLLPRIQYIYICIPF